MFPLWIISYALSNWIVRYLINVWLNPWSNGYATCTALNELFINWTIGSSSTWNDEFYAISTGLTVTWNAENLSFYRSSTSLTELFITDSIGNTIVQRKNNTDYPSREPWMRYRGTNQLYLWQRNADLYGNPNKLAYSPTNDALYLAWRGNVWGQDYSCWISTLTSSWISSKVYFPSWSGYSLGTMWEVCLDFNHQPIVALWGGDTCRYVYGPLWWPYFYTDTYGSWGVRWVTGSYLSNLWERSLGYAWWTFIVPSSDGWTRNVPAISWWMINNDIIHWRDGIWFLENNTRLIHYYSGTSFNFQQVTSFGKYFIYSRFVPSSTVIELLFIPKTKVRTEIIAALNTIYNESHILTLNYNAAATWYAYTASTLWSIPFETNTSTGTTLNTCPISSKQIVP